MTLKVPNEPHLTGILKEAYSGVTLDGHTLRVPAYTSVVIQ